MPSCHAHVHHGCYRQGCDEWGAVRDAAAIENLLKIDTLIVDKTGTLTEGRPTASAPWLPGMRRTQVLRLAASLDQGSEHPLAAAIAAVASETKA